MRDSPNSLLVAAEARRDASRCPACRTLSTSVHSRDHRQPADRPVSGQAIRLRLTIRRFSCRNPSCPRRTFAEQLPHRLGRHAQRTRRLAQAQVQTAVALAAHPRPGCCRTSPCRPAPRSCYGQSAACHCPPETGRALLALTTGRCAKGAPPGPSSSTSSAGVPSTSCRTVRPRRSPTGFDGSRRSGLSRATARPSTRAAPRRAHLRPSRLPTAGV